MVTEWAREEAKEAETTEVEEAAVAEEAAEATEVEVSRLDSEAVERFKTMIETIEEKEDPTMMTKLMRIEEAQEAATEDLEGTMMPQERTADLQETTEGRRDPETIEDQEMTVTTTIEDQLRAREEAVAESQTIEREDLQERPDPTIRRTTTTPTTMPQTDQEAPEAVAVAREAEAEVAVEAREEEVEAEVPAQEVMLQETRAEFENGRASHEIYCL